LATITIVAALSGCAATSPLANRALCTLDSQRMYLVSLWGWAGVSAEIDRRDAAIACAPPVRDAMDVEQRRAQKRQRAED
jgi:hypothetical protein